MIGTILYYVHYVLLLIYGIALSAAFAGVSSARENRVPLLLLFLGSGAAQLVMLLLFGADPIWKLYPLITHLPIVLVLCLHWRKSTASAIAAMCSAYLCCQPANWFGILVQTVTGSETAEYAVRILVLTLAGICVLKWFCPVASRIYSRDRESAWIFGIIPIVYYLFDYLVGIYTDLWQQNHRVTAEFLPFFLCIGHIIFCLVYYREFQQKADLEHREQLFRITLEQQTREVDTIRRTEQEVRLLRHDMRLMLNSLRLCLREGDRETGEKLIDGFSEEAGLSASPLKRYCENNTLNYILSDFAGRCEAAGVRFCPTVALSESIADEILFSFILSNALDNALNAQGLLPQSRRQIMLLLKNSNGKLLLSVKNPCKEAPLFSDGLPVSSRGRGHGYGTQSICYAAERLGGNCRFFMEGDQFVLQVVI